MTKMITFNELRKIKNSLPEGSSHRIADELNIDVQTVRNYFGGSDYKTGENCGIKSESKRYQKSGVQSRCEAARSVKKRYITLRLHHGKTVPMW